MSQQNIGQRLHAAVAAQQAGQREAARRLFEAVLADVPEQPMALNALGADALQRGDLAAAARLIRRASQADVSSSDLLLNLAHVLRLQGEGSEEREVLDRALVLAPHHFGVNVRLAELLEQEGSVVAAAARWAVAVNIAGQMKAMSPETRRIVDRATAWLADRNAAFADEVDGSLAATRAAIPPADRRRADAAIDHMLGRRPIYLNQCSGLHVPFLPADEFFERAALPWLGELEAATATIAGELSAVLADGKAMAGAFSPYVDLPAGVAPAQWAKLDKSQDWSAIHLWRDGDRDADACARFPATVALLDRLPLARLPRRMPNVFFSALAPRTHIPAHTGVTNARAIVHLPLIVPPGCRFRVGGETREWRKGEAFAFDDTIEHEAWNDSDRLRVVLILDAWNPHLGAADREMIAQFYAASEANSLAPTLVDRLSLG